MPTNSFHSFSVNDPVEVVHITELHSPIQNLERGSAYYGGLSSGSSTAYTVTLSPAPDSPYLTGMLVNFKVHAQNASGSPDVTLNVNSVGAKPLVINGGQSLAAGDLKANQLVSVVYDASGTGQFHLLALKSISVLDDLGDVSISSPSSGQVVRYGGSGFSNANLTASDLPSGIDATKVGGGAVNNSELAYLDGVTSAIQTQLNGKAATSHSHTAAEIVSGQLALGRGGTAADLTSSGGTGQVLKQTTSGGAITVAALAAGEMPTGIDASKLGGGAVSNTEFGYLDGVASAIQTQLNGKAALSHVHAAADITSGQFALARGGSGADLSATGGSGYIVKQNSAGGAFTVGRLTATDLPDGNFSVLNSIPGTFITKRNLNSASGTVDVGSPAAGKRWVVLQGTVFNSTGATGSKTFTSGVKLSGTFYPISVLGTFSFVGWGAFWGFYYPILESTDTLSYTTSGTGLNVFYDILEISTSVPLKTLRLTSLASGSNTLYTCPAGKTAVPVAIQGRSVIRGGVNYYNGGGSYRNVSPNLCVSGDTALTPGSGSNSMLGENASVAPSTLAFWNRLGALAAGDFVSIRTDAAGSQAAWVNVLEIG